MSLVTFVPASGERPGEGGTLFHQPSGQVLLPDGKVLPIRYWDYPGVPDPPSAKAALTLAQNICKRWGLKVTMQAVQGPALEIVIETPDHEPGDPAYRRERLPAGELALLAAVPGGMETATAFIMQRLGYQA